MLWLSVVVVVVDVVVISFDGKHRGGVSGLLPKGERQEIKASLAEVRDR